MAVAITGNSYSTGNQVTAATQNAQVNALTFDTGAVDDSTTQLSSGAIIVKDGGITAQKIGSAAVTPAKISTGASWEFGGAAGSIATPATATTNLLLYNVSATNWGGLFAATNGDIAIANATSGTIATNLVVTASGKVGIGTDVPALKLDVNDNGMIIRTDRTPSSASDTGTKGTIAWDVNYVYVCIATDTWQRTATATW